MTLVRIQVALCAIALALLGGLGCDAADDGAGASGTGGSGGAGGVSGGTGGAGGSAGLGGSSGAAGTAGAGGTAGTGAGAGGGGGMTGGGSGATGGTGGEAGSDAGSELDASTTEDPCTTALFCETFESFTVGSAPGGDWEQRTNRGAVSVVGDQKHGGAKSVRFTTEASEDSKTAFIHLASDDVFPAPGNVYFGRMMFRLESAPEKAVHWTFIQSSGLVPGESYHAMYRYGGQHPVSGGNQLMANYETPDSYGGNGPSSDCWFHADGVVVPTARWACAEWQFDGPNNTMRFWLDGEPVDSLTMTGTGEGCVHQDASYPWLAPSFENLDLGWESYQPDDARTLYIDDVILDSTRIGCPTP